MLRKQLYALLTVFVIIFTASPTTARITPLAFKGVTQHFADGKEFYSPVLGMIAMEQGLMRNLRFYGNFTPFHDEAGKRIYVRDYSKDPLWNLVKELFPSPAGMLGASSLSGANFGRHVDKPETIALLLDYAYKIRNTPEKANISKKQKAAEKLQYKEQIYGTLQNYRDDPEHPTHEKNLKQTINRILTSIEQSVIHEQEQGYPKYITEQVILAFFCEKFDTQSDIWTLLRGLKQLRPEILKDDYKIPDQEDLLKKEDIDDDIGITRKFTLDDFYNLAHIDIFTSPVPYKANTQPLSNGNTRAYDRRENKEISTIFADCIEISIRHLVNLITYDPAQKRFNLDPISQYVSNHQDTNPFFDNFINFYKEQSPMQANAGNINIRSLWNQVVGDLNVFNEDEITINYLKTHDGKGGQYNLDSGFINFINVFRKIFNLSLEDEALESLNLANATTDQKKQWVTAYLETLLTVLNPGKAYKIEATLQDGFSYSGAPDLFGEIKVTVTDKDSSRQLFSFVIAISKGHGQIINLVIPEGMTGYFDLTGIFERAYPQGYEGSILKDSLALLDKSLTKKIYHPLYRLFSQPLEDNESRISLLKTVADNYQDWKSQNMLNEHLASSIISHVLHNFSWDDVHTLYRVSPLILQLEVLGLINQNEVKGLALRKIIDIDKELQGIIEKYPNLEYLALSYNPYLKVLFLNNLRNLKVLNLESSSVKEIMGLENLIALKELNLSGTKNLKTLSLANLLNLKRLNLDSSSVREIMGLENLTALEELTLSDTDNLETLSLDNLPNLKGLNLGSSSVKKIMGLENLTALERLDLSRTYNLETISLDNLPNLKGLDLSNSSVKEIMGLENLTALERLMLSGTKNLETIFLGGLPNLKGLDLSNSAVKEVNLQNLTALEQLILSGTNNLKTISLANLPNLKGLDLSNSAVKEVNLKNLTALEDLDLSGAKKLETLSLDNLRNLKKLGIYNYLVKKINLKNLTALEEIDLSGTKNLETISLDNLEKLELLILEESSVETEKIIGLGLLKEVEIIR